MGRARYLWNVVTGMRRVMLNAGAEEKACPHCGRNTPLYHHTGDKGAASCLWCGKPVDIFVCQICDKPFQQDERIYAEPARGIYGGAHRECIALTVVGTIP